MKKLELKDPAAIAQALAAGAVSVRAHATREAHMRAQRYETWYTRPLGKRVGQHRERFFARLRLFELACPRCGEVWTGRSKAPRRAEAEKELRELAGPDAPAGARQEALRAHRERARARDPRRRRSWDPRTHVWTCKSCGLSLQLGIIAHVAPYDPGRTYPPEDTVPTLREARALAARSPFWAQAKELAAKTGESLGLVLERLEQQTRGLMWKAWGATFRGVLQRDRLSASSRINELHEEIAGSGESSDDDSTT